MESLKKYLKRNGIAFEAVAEWSLIFGNNPEGIFIEASAAPLKYIKRAGLKYEYRANYTSVFVYP